jgi:hypothetical protein
MTNSCIMRNCTKCAYLGKVCKVYNFVLIEILNGVYKACLSKMYSGWTHCLLPMYYKIYSTNCIECFIEEEL